MTEPGGAPVTFLFTDIEGSTAHWEEHPDAMRAALNRHDGILRGLVVHHGGRVVKGTGDGICSVFDEAPAALEAALAIQGVIRASSWSEIGGLRVRVALHAGDAEWRDGDYYGQAVNRAARLLSEADGGEIVISEVIAETVRLNLPRRTSLEHLGERWLKGVSEPLRVYRVLTTPAAGPVTQPNATPLRSNVVDGGVPGTSPAPTQVRIYTLGTFRVEVRGHRIDDEQWGRRKSRQILKCLLTRPNRRLTRDEAYELFWPESDAAPGNLRVAIHALRQVLSAGSATRAGDLILLEHEYVAIRHDADIWVDADAFEQLLSAARRSASAGEMLEAAAALYRGEYLPDDLYEDWSTPRRDSLRRLWVDCQFGLSRARERRGDVDAAVDALQRLLDIDACDERAAGELTQLLARNGRRLEALRVYQRLEDALHEDLGVEPSPETAEIRRRIVAEATLQATLVGRSPISTRPEPPTPGAAPHAETPSTTFDPSYPFPTPDLLVDRQQERTLMLRTLDRGRTAGRTILIGAPAGTGKSTVAGLLVDEARSRGYLCLVGGSLDQDSPIPFGPIRGALADYLLAQEPDWLREEIGVVVADLEPIVPELRYHLALSESRASDQPDTSRLLGVIHACLRALTRRQPVVVCLEDLHAVDGATLDALHYLAQQTRRLPLTLVGTYRSEDLASDRPLARLLTTLRRERIADDVQLRPLDRDETSQLTSVLLDGPATVELADSLYEVTEGNPLFVEQLVLALREDGQIDNEDGTWRRTASDGRPIPSIVRTVIEGRFSRLRASGNDTLEMAAVLGQAFDLRTLTVALGADGSDVVLADLDEALSAQLVRETTTGFQFAHAMVREALYRSLSGSRRRRLHAQAGAAIEQIASHNLDDRAAELARHFLLAGDDVSTRNQALAYSLMAGRHAAGLSAHREAYDHFSRAYDLADRGGYGEPGARLDALDGRGTAQLRLGQWTACISDFRDLLAHTSGPTRRAWARVAVSRALSQLGDTDGVLAEIDLGLAECEAADDPGIREPCLWLRYNRAFIWYLRGRYRDLQELGQEILATATELDQPKGLAAAYNVLAWSWMGQGRVDEALREYDQALLAATRAGDKNSMAIAEDNIGIQNYRGARFAPARMHLERAIALYRQLAGELRTVNAIQTLGRIALAEGNVEEASAHAEAARAAAVDGQDRFIAECQDLLGSIHALRDESDAASACFEQALAVRERVGHAAGVVESLIGLGAVFERRGSLKQAQEHYQRAMELAEEMDPCPQLLAARRSLGRLLTKAGDERGRQLLGAALDLAASMPESIEVAPTYLAVAEARLIDAPEASLDFAERALAARPTAEVAVEAHAMATQAALVLGDADAAAAHAASCSALAQRIGSPSRLDEATRLVTVTSPRK